MKKLFLMVMSLAATMCTFTSCEWDDDVTTSMVLSGCWDGDFGMCYDYEYRGHYYTVNAYCTDLEFVPFEHSYTSGYGYQVDFYRDGPWDKVYHSFTWEVRNSVIYLDYRHPEDEDLNTFLRDYEMDNNYLTGYFGNTNSRFRMAKYEDYYDWTPYIRTYGYGDYYHGYGYGFHDYEDWYDYYAPTRSVAQDSAEEAPKMLRYYNRNVAE